ncbi:alpha/beta fold hydrolase [Acinetobacter pittii]|uniref:alpha/beta fold hydrolase n=1 Tax=Acinetobacter pittii TaxID=48296 RepID=UPI00300A0349
MQQNKDQAQHLSKQKSKPNFLFVHGAWQGAWVWDEVIQKLTTQGIFARAFDLPGSGTDQTPISNVTLDTYVQAIISQAKSMPLGPLILVGHSMGGAAITAAASAAPNLFHQLVYVCAFLPRSSESVAALAKEGHALSGSGPKVELVDAGLASRLLPDSIASTFFNDCSPQIIQHFLPKFRPQPITPVVTPVTLSEGFIILPKTYIHCTRDNAVSSELQLLMASRANIDDIQTLDSGHEPFISQPENLVRILLQASNFS